MWKLNWSGSNEKKRNHPKETESSLRFTCVIDWSWPLKNILHEAWIIISAIQSGFSDEKSTSVAEEQRVGPAVTSLRPFLQIILENVTVEWPVPPKQDWQGQGAQSNRCFFCSLSASHDMLGKPRRACPVRTGCPGSFI
jgi:hypothetical protein